MNSIAEANSGTSAVREAHRFDEAALDRWLAAIFHGIKGRVIRGTAANAQARQRAEVLPKLIRIAWEQAERAGAC